VFNVQRYDKREVLKYCAHFVHMQSLYPFWGQSQFLGGSRKRWFLAKRR